MCALACFEAVAGDVFLSVHYPLQRRLRLQKYYKEMQNSSAKSRPLVYQQRQKGDLHAFVHGNPSQQVYSLLLPSSPPPAPTHPTTSLFDRYHRTLLLLTEVDSPDLQTVSRQIVLHEQPLSSQLGRKIEIAQEREKGKGSKGDGVGDLRPTQEFLRNEALFNYEEVGQLKRKQKQEYLSQIERMVAQAEKEIGDIEAIQREEHQQVEGLQNHQELLRNQLTNHLHQGLIQQGQTYAWSPPPQAPPQLHSQMHPKQINQVLEEHFQLNEDLLQRASQARHWGKGKPMGSSASQFGKTVLKGKVPQKSLTSTNKGRFKH